MAKYYAGTDIKYGKVADGGDLEEVTFKQHDEVTGLPESTMKELWDAGSLYVKDTQGDGDDKQEVQVTSSTGDVPGQPTPPQMQGENAESPKAPAGQDDPNRPGAQTTATPAKTSPTKAQPTKTTSGGGSGQSGS